MILIIGAGLGGLSLGRTLQKKGIPFRIFDQSPGARFQGFGLSLHDHSIPSLSALLDVDEPELRRLVSVDRETSFLPSVLYDALSGNTYNNPNTAHQADHRDFRTNRERLWRTIQGDLNVENGYKLCDIQHRDGRVVATFTNGEVVEGDFMVAADGVHSFARKFLTPNTVTKDWGGIFFNGTIKISKEEFEKEYKPWMDGLAVKIGFYDESVVGVTIYDVDETTGEYYLSWAYSRRSTGDDDPLFVPYAAGKDKLRAAPTPYEEIENLPPMVRPWSTMFERKEIRNDPLIRQTLVQHLIPVEDLIKNARENKVVFIGDAAHAWSNTAGTAGNEAILDGITLGNQIINKGLENPEGFYEQRYATWENAIAYNAQLFEEMHKPREKWLRLRSTAPGVDLL